MDNINMQELISFINWEELRIWLLFLFGIIGGVICHSHIFHKLRHTFGEDYHGRIDTHSQQSPHYGTRQYAKSFSVIDSGTDTKSQHLTQCSKNSEFNETHYHAMCSVERLIPIVDGFTHKEWQEYYHQNKNKEEVLFFHTKVMFFINNVANILKLF